MMENRWKYTDPNNQPEPMHQLGDIVYVRCPWDRLAYEHISKSEVRKIVVRWLTDHWDILYYLRTDIDDNRLKSSRLNPYYYEDGSVRTMFDTPQEVMEKNIVRFIEGVHNKVDAITKTMRQLGYKEPVIIDKLCHLVVHETKEIGKSDERALR